MAKKAWKGGQEKTWEESRASLIQADSFQLQAIRELIEGEESKGSPGESGQIQDSPFRFRTKPCKVQRGSAMEGQGQWKGTQAWFGCLVNKEDCKECLLPLILLSFSRHKDKIKTNHLKPYLWLWSNGMMSSFMPYSSLAVWFLEYFYRIEVLSVCRCFFSYWISYSIWWTPDGVNLASFVLWPYLTIFLKFMSWGI